MNLIVSDSLPLKKLIKNQKLTKETIVPFINPLKKK